MSLPRKRADAICPCGNPVRTGRFYCSPQCRGVSMRRPLTICPECGAGFKWKRGGPGTWCSRRCFGHAKGRTMRGSRACRTDENQAGIVSDLRRIGASVWDASQVGNGFPDLIVAFRGQTHLFEVKNPKTKHGKAGLSKNQRRFADEWRGGPVYVVKTAAEAVNLLIDLDRRADPKVLMIVGGSK